MSEVSSQNFFSEILRRVTKLIPSLLKLECATPSLCHIRRCLTAAGARVCPPWHFEGNRQTIAATTGAVAAAETAHNVQFPRVRKCIFYLLLLVLIITIAKSDEFMCSCMSLLIQVVVIFAQQHTETCQCLGREL